jgi:hypothetical protein
MYLDFVTDFHDTDLALERLVLLLAPHGMSAFLGLEVGPYLSERAKQRFQHEGDDVVGDWAPLQQATVEIREAQNLPGEHPINRRFGALENWVVRGGWHAYPAGFGGALRYPANDPSGTTREKAITAQKGSLSPSTVPRPVLGVNENDMIFVLTALAFSIQEAFK